MRRWISVALFCSFVFLLVSSVVLYIEPPGRLAFWANWHLLGLDKHQWDALHTVFGFLFALLSVWHLFLNWRSLTRYFKAPLTVLVVFSLSILVCWGTVTYKVPFRYIIDLQEALKNSWAVAPPPVPHAEAMPLGRLAKMIGLEPQQALKRLQQAGIKVSSPREKFGQIAEKNGKRPEQLFRILQGQDNTKRRF